MRTDAHTAGWVELGLVPGLAAASFRKLLSAFGLPGEILKASQAQLACVVSEALAERIAARPSRDEIDRTLAWLENDRHTLLTLADSAYPRQLLETHDPPPMLYVRGDAALLTRPALAIVGSRNATPQGIATAEAFAHHLSECGFTVVSGLALGIDAAAHRGALRGPGSTVAVLGTGADVVYPRSNAALAAQIAASGALVSEFALGAPPVREHFPRRNRVISALTRGCLVVEAALSSGSLITARMAAEQGREVFAIPGSIHSPVARGCHALIKQGAKLVESAEDVLAELGGAPLRVQAKPDPQPWDPEDGLLQHMGYEACEIGALIGRSGLTPEAVSAMLLQLELEGRVGSLPGGLYQRIS
jgi:DNA processing protein